MTSSQVMKRRSFLRGAAAGGLAIGLGAACGPSTSGSQSAAPSAAASALPRRGGTAVLAQLANPNPGGMMGSVTINFAVRKLVFDFLTDYSPGNLTPRPMLAKSWSISPDGKSVALQLRDDVKFHNGRAFGPKDVVFNVEQCLVPANVSPAYSTLLLVFQDVAATGANEVTLRFKQPFASMFDWFLSMPILDPESFADLKKGTTLNGTGPFVWKSYTPGTGVTLARNTGYWQKDLPYLDAVELRIIPQVQAMSLALQAGQIHRALGLSQAEVNALKGNAKIDPGISQSYFSGYFAAGNVKVDPISRKEFRQAMAYAIDRERIFKEVFSSNGFVSSLPWSKASPGYDEALGKTYTYDPTKAKQLLASAGITNVKPLELGVGLQRTGDLQMAQIVQANLKDVGVETNIKTYEQAVFNELGTRGAYPGLVVLAHTWGHVQPYTIFSSRPFDLVSGTTGFTPNAEYSRIASSLLTARTDAEQKAALRDFNTFFLDQAFIAELVIAPQIAPLSVSLVGAQDDQIGQQVLTSAYLAQ